METVIKKAIDPDTEEEYEIELPAPERVRRAILELDFPPDGIRTIGATDMLAEKFRLSEKEKSAQKKSGNRYLDVFRYDIVAPAIKKLLDEKKLKQPKGPKKPYFLVQEEEQKDIKEEEEEVMPTVENIEDIYQKVHKELAEELLKEIKSKSKRPPFFERLVIKLLLEMGYGGFEEDAGEVVGGSGDGGIDGIIKQDKLGVDEVYVQAKNKNEKIGAPAIRDFIGALDGKRAQKGIFITISDFTLSAEQAADRSTKKIVLINGTQLAKLMIEHNVGVSTSKTYEIKRVDSDYFAETE